MIQKLKMGQCVKISQHIIVMTCFKFGLQKNVNEAQIIKLGQIKDRLTSDGSINLKKRQSLFFITTPVFAYSNLFM